MSAQANLGAVVIAGRALLIEGKPGSGKSSLALALIDRGAKLIGDDGVRFSVEDGRLVASPPPNTAGMIEIRNVGIVELPCTSAPVALLLRLDPAAPRFPLEVPTRRIEGVPIPELSFAAGDGAQALRAEWALEKHGLAFAPAVEKAQDRM